MYIKVYNLITKRFKTKNREKRKFLLAGLLNVLITNIFLQIFLFTNLFNITVSSNYSGYRIDKFLQSQIDELSRTRLQALIYDGHVKLNNVLSTYHPQLREWIRNNQKEKSIKKSIDFFFPI